MAYITPSQSVNCGGAKLDKNDSIGDTSGVDISIDGNIAGDLAQEILRNALSIAEENSALALDLAGDINSFVPDTSTVTFPTDISTPIDFNTAMDHLNYLLSRLADQPDLLDISQDVASLGDLDTIPDIDPPTINDFTTAAPTLEFADQPTFTIPDTPLSPEIVNPTPPDYPSLTEPTEPVLAGISIPTPPVLSLGEFDEELTEEELPQLTAEFNWNEEEYSSELLDAMVAVLLRDIQNGSYGIETTDEELMWQRAREREQQALNQRLEEVSREWSLGGFSLPPGAMMKAVDTANQEFLLKTSSLNREQTLEHSNKYWDGKKFTIDQSRQVEQMLMTYHGAMQERALNAARAEVEVSVAILNAHIAKFTANQQRYLIKAQVFEAQTRAELAKVEIYKAQIDAVNSLVGYNRALVEMYNAQLNAVKNIVDRYRVQVEAYNVTMNVEKLKIEIFAEQVNAFVGIIRGKEAEFKAYEASINGERAKAQAYEAEARAYEASVQGKKANIEAQVAEVNAYVARNQNVIDVFRAENDSLNSIRQAQLASNQSDVALYQADVQRFAAEADAARKAFDLSSEIEENEYRVQLEALQASIENAKNQLYRVLEISKIRTESLRAAGDVHRSLAAAALSAINANASLSQSAGTSISRSFNQSQQTSKINSYSESRACNMQYSESVSWGFTEGYSESISDTTQTANTTAYQRTDHWNDPSGVNVIVNSSIAAE